VFESIDAYLQALRNALRGCDPALVQDALGETESRIRQQLGRIAWEAPLLSGAEALNRVCESLGSPEEVAQAYLKRDELVEQVLRPQPVPDDMAPEPSPQPWPSFMGILQEPRAYTSLLYLLFSMITGIFYFTWIVTGLSISLGLIVLVIGFPMLVLMLGSVRLLALGEGRLVEALLDVRMPRHPPFLPKGKDWMERIGYLFKDAYTWTGLIYLLLQMPLGIVYFTIMVTAISVSGGLLSVPAISWIFGNQAAIHIDCWPYWQQHHPIWLVGIIGLVGVLGLVGSLHLALGLGRLHGSLAKALLVKK
jgi:hypothetical protein